MITISIITIPAILLTLWLAIVSIKDKDWAMAICIPLFVLSIISLYVTLYIQWQERDTNLAVVKFSHWISDLIPVVLYVFFCSRFKVKWINQTTIVLLLFTLLNLSTGMTLYLGEQWGANPPIDDRLYLYVCGQSVFNIKLWQLCMALQFLWVIFRFYHYVKKTNKRHLHFSDKSKKLSLTMDFVFIIGFSSLFIPADFWYSTEMPLYITYTLVIIGVCACLYMLIKGYALLLVLDPNNEPAIFMTDGEPINIWETIQHIIEDGKLYLQSNIHLAKVAQLVGTNRTYITYAINKNTGSNFNGYINSLRVAYATDMMNNYPEKKMDEIAELCGFGSASSFTKIYKKQTGLTPKDAKKKGIKVSQHSVKK